MAALTEVWNALQHVHDKKSQGSFDEFTFDCITLTSGTGSGNANVADATDLFSNDENANNNNNTCMNNTELAFSKFLSGEFVRQPFILASIERKISIAEDNQKQPTSTQTTTLNTTTPRKTVTARTDSQTLSDDSSVSVWGSPLKCNIPTDDSMEISGSLDLSQLSHKSKKQKPKRLGIPLKWARTIVSAFNVKGDCSTTCQAPSVLVLCDGQDKRQTAIMGVHMFPVRLETRMAKGLKTVMVTVDDKGSLSDWSIKVNLSGRQNQSCQAVYQVSTGPADREEPLGTVAVEVRWKGATCLLEVPPAESSTVIKASVRTGSLQSSINSYYQELQFLSSIISALTTGQVEWVSASSEQSNISLSAAVKSFIETQDEDTQVSAAAHNDEENAEKWTFDAALKTFGIAERKDYDFTDRLWKVLLNCMSEASLLSALRQVFSALGSGKLRPFVERHNRTMVAQMVRETYSGRFSCPSLVGLQPFLFLAQMGAEKLRRDYIHLFVSQTLATPALLEPLTGGGGLLETDRDLRDKLGDLEKLHGVLEMVTMLGSSLRLPVHSLRAVSQIMLDHHLLHPVRPGHVFSFSVKTSDVRAVLGAVRPTMWCVETSSSVAGCGGDGVRQSSLHYLCAAQPFLHLQGRLPVVGRDDVESVENGPGSGGQGELQGQYYLVHRKETVVVV